MYFNRKNAEQKNWRMIKKGKHFLFGCSLVFAVGASLATQVVHANTAETTVANNSTTGDVNPTQNGDGKTYEAPAVAENKPEVAGTPAVSTTEPAVAAKLDGETAKEVKALDKTKLENYIAEIEAKLANGTYENKTEESVAVLKADLEAAKATLANATTQGEITKAYNKLVTTANTKLKNKPVEKKETPAVDTTNGKETVGKKAENTEKKSESNSIENTGSNDPRNGKALDKNNAFRAEIAYNIDSQGNDYGKKDSVITSGIRGSSESGNAITAVNSVMKYRARYNTDATGKITSVDWQVFFNDHLQNFANDYGVKNEVFRNYIQIPNEVNMPTDIRRLQYRAEMKFVDRKYQLVGGDGTGLSDTVTFDNPTPATAAGRALAKNENLTINGSWDNYTRGLDTLYNNTSFYYKDAVKDEISDTKNLVNSNALPGKRVIYDNANTGGNYRDGYVWEFTTTVPDRVTNEQLKNMKVSMGMLSTGTAGVDHGFHRIAENPVNLSKADVTPPTVKTQTVKVNEQPKAENSIANFKDLPAGTKAEFKTPVNTATPGEKTATAVVTYSDGSKVEGPVKVIVEKEAATPAAPAVPPTVEIKYSDPAPNKKEVYVYASEVNSFDIKIKDDSGKIASAELRRGSNQEFKDVAGETNKQDTQYGFTANKFTSETTATAENPAVITYTGTPAPEGDFTKEKFEKAIQDGGTPLGWRFVKAIDKDGADARGNGRDATDPTAVNVILKPQTLKYDIQTPAEADKVVVSDVNNVTDKEFEKIKEKVKVEYSQNNPDARLADKKGKEVEDASKVVDKVEKEGNNLVVTYKDGSQDKKPLSEFVRTNEKPTVEIQYSDPAPDKKEVYVYASEVNSFDIKIKDDSGKLASAELRRGSNQEFKDVAGETNKQNTEYGFTANKFTTETPATEENPAVITYTGTPAPEGKFTKEKFEKAIQDGGTPLGWRFVKAIDKDGADARGNGRDVTDPTAVNVILKPQTQKYDIKTPAEADKVVVSDVNNVTDKEFEKIKEKVKLEYSQNNPDARLVDKKGTEVENPADRIASITKDGNDVVVTYKDGSKDTKPLSEFVNKDTTAPAKPNAGNDVVKPADKTVVANPEKLTDAEKKAIEDKVKAVNPGATVVVDDKGNATVTTPSGNTAVIPAADLTKTADDAAKPNAGNDVVKPADKTVVANPEKLTDAEKKAIEDKVKAVNPGATVVVDDKGNATVTTPSGNTAVIPAADLTKTADDAAKPNAGNDVVKPADKTVVANPEKLTDAEKKAIEDKVKAVNPGATVVVDDKGNATVTTPSGNTAVIPAADLTKTADDAAKPNAGNDVVKPADKTVVANPEKLTDAEKKAIEDKVKAVNPGATVVVDDKGNATVTTPSGNTAVIPAADLTKTSEDATKPNAGNDVVKPADKTVVANPEKLTDAEKKAIEDKVKAVNPGATVVVDDKGNATVTTPSGNTAVIPAADLTKTADDAAKPNAGNDVVKPADKTVVANPEKLTDAEKKAIEDKVKAVNPGATVVVDDKGNATVTTPSGNTAVIPAADLTKTADDAAKPNAGNDVVKPADKTVVANPEKLTDAEKKAIEDKVKAVNPGATVVVDDKGNATVTTPSGNTAVIPAADLTKTADDAAKPNAGNDVVKPADKTVVANPEKLTDAEKKAIEDKVKAVNPGATVVVDDKGNATVTTPSGNTAVIPAADLTKTADDAAKPNAGNDVVKPADKTVVANPEKLTDAEKKAIEDKVKAVNPGATVVVDDKGNATVTTPSGNTAVIPAADLTKTADDAAKPNAGNDVVKPADKTVVANPEKLTDAEKKAIEDKVKAVNPGATVVVDDKGNATVTTPEGKTAVIPATDLTKSPEDAAKPEAGNDIVKPADKTVVKDPANLTPEEKKAIEDKVKAVNPGATVVVDDKGNATVTTPEGKTAVIPATDLTKSPEDAAKPKAGNDINTPATRVLVVDKANLTPEEKKAIEDKVKAVNPGATVVVDDKGNATVTTPEGKTAVIPAVQLVKDAKDVATKNNGENINVDFEKETVADFNNLTDAEKEAAKVKIKGANADVVEVIFDKAGNATVITKDGKVYTIVAKDIFKQRSYVPSNDGGNNSGNGNGTSDNNGATDAKVDKAKLEGAIRQLDELIIKESAKLDAETAKEANALSADAKKVFANADATQAEVDAMVKRIEDFMAKVSSSTDHATPANDQAAQTPAVAPATTQAAANASQTASAQANARKAAKELPNTGTADSTVAMAAAAASALLGLGLAGRRRKEDEEA